jgi:hypothetical protein
MAKKENIMDRLHKAEKKGTNVPFGYNHAERNAFFGKPYVASDLKKSNPKYKTSKSKALRMKK